MKIGTLAAIAVFLLAQIVAPSVIPYGLDEASAQGKQDTSEASGKDQAAFPHGGPIGIAEGNYTGKVIAKSEDTVIIRQPSGQEVTLIVGGDTGRDLKIGDEIEANLKSGGPVDSVKKIRSGEVGGGLSSSGTTGHQSMTDVGAK